MKNAVYILPNTKQAHEDFQWTRQEIMAHKGKATILKVDSIEEINNQEIIDEFQKTRNKAYHDIVSRSFELQRYIERSVKRNRVPMAQKTKFEAEVKKLRTRIDEIISLDYFPAPNREEAEEAIMTCLEIIERFKVSPRKKQPAQTVSPMKVYDKKGFQNETWVTRKGLHIDRIASSWLIKRFIDKEAGFSFIREGSTLKNGIGFDIYDIEFSHRGEDCTFEVLLKSFNLKDPVLVRISEVVHDIDLKDDKFGRKEAEGINQVIIGLSQKLNNDKKLLAGGMEIFDSLYQYYSSQKRKGGNRYAGSKRT